MQAAASRTKEEDQAGARSGEDGYQQRVDGPHQGNRTRRWHTALPNAGRANEAALCGGGECELARTDDGDAPPRGDLLCESCRADISPAPFEPVVRSGA